MQLATPDLPEAGSALFVAIIQVAIAVGSLVGGTVVDQVGIPADFWFGSALALLGLAAVACFGATVKDLRQCEAHGSGATGIAPGPVRVPARLRATGPHRHQQRILLRAPAARH